MAISNEFQKLLDDYASRYRARDAAGCASVFAPPAELLSPYGPPLRGRAAIEQAHRAWVKEGGDTKAMDVADAGVAGDLGWRLARYSEGSAGSGTSLDILERQPDGMSDQALQPQPGFLADITPVANQLASFALSQTPEGIGGKRDRPQAGALRAMRYAARSVRAVRGRRVEAREADMGRWIAIRTAIVAPCLRRSGRFSILHRNRRTGR